MTRVWAISDLHLSQANPERRDRLAGRWRDHVERVEQNWRKAIAPSDVVLVPGDVSAARNHRDLQPDLAWLERLPGIKVLSQGNHDTWWNGVAKIRPMLRPSLRAVGGDAVEVGGTIACGTRGAPAATDETITTGLRALWDQELDSLDRALAAASALRTGNQPLFVLWHYPPFDRHGRRTPVVERLEQAQATACVYGHLHQLQQWATTTQGTIGGVRYYCVAADAIGFHPLRIL